MKPDGYSLRSISDYFKYLRTNFKFTRKIVPGRMYSYHYNFSKEYPREEVRLYDYEPLVFIFEVRGKYALGMNFHHMPPKPRMIWFDRISKLSRRLDETVRIRGLGGQPVYRIYGLNYPKVYQVLRKTKVAIRKYRLDRITNARAIDLRKFKEVSAFFARTYFDANIADIRMRYNKFVP